MLTMCIATNNGSTGNNLLYAFQWTAREFPQKFPVLLPQQSLCMTISMANVTLRKLNHQCGLVKTIIIISK